VLGAAVARRRRRGQDRGSITATLHGEERCVAITNERLPSMAQREALAVYLTDGGIFIFEAEP
jgi:hypothetical protein